MVLAPKSNVELVLRLDLKKSMVVYVHIAHQSHLNINVQKMNVIYAKHSIQLFWVIAIVKNANQKKKKWTKIINILIL